MHVFEFLNEPPSAPLVVLAGEDGFLRRLALNALTREHEEAAVDRLDGTRAQWRDVLDELSTRSLFGGGESRTVVVEDADPFVKDHRAKLEGYVQAPRNTGRLVLEVTQWPGNTRLYKLVEKHGLLVECAPPLTLRGKRKYPDDAAAKKWIQHWALEQHAIQLLREAADRLWELAGPNLGLIDQELAKLALYANPDGESGGRVDVDLVQQVVGGWRTETTWEMLEAALRGETARALLQLDRLLYAGEHPNALFGQISWSLRRYAAAARAFQRSEAQGRRLPLQEALKQGGFRWPAELQQAEKHLLQLGRARALKLNTWLLEMDLALKGSHSAPDRARFQLEQLLLRLHRSLRNQGA